MTEQERIISGFSLIELEKYLSVSGRRLPAACTGPELGGGAEWVSVSTVIKRRQTDGRERRRDDEAAA